MHKVCKDKIEDIQNLLSNASADRSEIESHIKDCPACSEYYNSMKTVKSYLGSLELNAPSDMKQRVMAALEKERAESSRKDRRFLKPAYIAAYAAAACLVLVCALFLYNGGFFKGLNWTTSEMLSDEKAMEEKAFGDEEESRQNMLTPSESNDAAVPENQPGPVPEDGLLESAGAPGMTAKSLEDEGYMFYSSAFGGENQQVFNLGGKDLAAVYGIDDYDVIVYATTAYGHKEAKEILITRFGLEAELTDGITTLNNVPAEMIPAIEIALDLVASESASTQKAGYNLMIIHLD